MATTRKTAAKSNTFEVTLDLARTTKNTFRFEAEDEDAPINPLYIQKSAFNGKEPSSVTVTVTFS